MKILVLTPGIFPDRHSGIPKLVYYLARECSRLGHRITVLTRQYEPGHPRYEIVDSMICHRIPIAHNGTPFHPLWPIETAIKSWRSQKKLVRENGLFDVVWVNNPWWMTPAHPNRVWPRARVVYDFHCDATSELVENHGPGLSSRIFGRIYDRVATWAMNKSDRIIVHSLFTRSKCLSLVGEESAQKISLVPGGADPDLYFPAHPNLKREMKERFGLPTDRPVFITARGLRPRTGVDKLVEAAALLAGDGPPFYLVIVGQGVLRPQIADLIRARKLETKVRLVSDLTEKELAEYYRASDVFVLPTQDAEGFGLATVEALASGLTVLGTNNSATPEILGRFNPSWLIQGCDPESIGASLADYCRHPEKYDMPPETIRQKAVENYSWRVSARLFLETVADKT